MLFAPSLGGGERCISWAIDRRGRRASSPIDRVQPKAFRSVSSRLSWHFLHCAKDSCHSSMSRSSKFQSSCCFMFNWMASKYFEVNREVIINLLLSAQPSLARQLSFAFDSDSLSKSLMSDHRLIDSDSELSPMPIGPVTHLKLHLVTQLTVSQLPLSASLPDSGLARLGWRYILNTQRKGRKRETRDHRRRGRSQTRGQRGQNRGKAEAVSCSIQTVFLSSHASLFTPTPSVSPCPCPSAP